MSLEKLEERFVVQYRNGRTQPFYDMYNVESFNDAKNAMLDLKEGFEENSESFSEENARIIRQVIFTVDVYNVNGEKI